jgi:glycine betaine/proline transport system ATP-binding protein
VNESRDFLPVADKAGKVIGSMRRQDALDILLGSE